MAISFNQIPQKINTPLFYAEVDNSAANTTVEDMKALIIAPMLAVGQATKEQVIAVGTYEEAVKLFGAGSIASLMVKAYRNQDALGELHVLPLEDVSEGTQAQATFTVEGNSTAAGMLYLYIGDTLVQVAVDKSQDASTIAGNIIAAVNANTLLPVTAEAAEGVVTIKSKHKGVIGGDFALGVNNLGANNGQVFPAGVTVTVSEVTPGTGSPDFEKVLATLKDEPYEFIAVPYSEKTVLDRCKTFMTKRWDYSSQLYGHVYSVKKGERNDFLSVGEEQNDPALTVFAVNKLRKTSAFEILGAVLGQVAKSVKADPARPFQTLSLNGIATAPLTARFSREERESILGAGVATLVDTSSNIQIERSVTTYITNAYGSADNSYQDAQTRHTLGYIIRYLRSRITSKFGRHKLANDGTKFGEGQAVVTPSIIKSELIAAYSVLETMGLVENMKLFKENLVVERNITDPNRIDVLFGPDLVNQLRVFATLVQFRLQY